MCPGKCGIPEQSMCLSVETQRPLNLTSLTITKLLIFYRHVRLCVRTQLEECFLFVTGAENCPWPGYNVEPRHLSALLAPSLSPGSVRGPVAAACASVNCSLKSVVDFNSKVFKRLISVFFCFLLGNEFSPRDLTLILTPLMTRVFLNVLLLVCSVLLANRTICVVYNRTVPDTLTYLTYVTKGLG